MSAMRLAWLGSVRQPARTALGVLGVVAVGALLLDMLLLSRGLVLSFGDLLNRGGFDVRILASDTPLSGMLIDHVTSTADAISKLPDVEAVSAIRIGHADLAAEAVPSTSAPAAAPDRIEFVGIDPRARPTWTVVEGRDLGAAIGVRQPLVVNRGLATELHLAPGSIVRLRASCGQSGTAVPPIAFEVVGVAEFPFDDKDARTVAGTLADHGGLCGGVAGDQADLILVKSRPGVGATAAAAAIRAVRPDLHVVTNDELLEQFSRIEFSYFQQISVVLSSVTLFFGFLLIAVLLTVSVNQRLGEIAALRALGLSRGRVMAGVFYESAILVGIGGLLAVPVGTILSVWLDRILHALPGIPTSVSFFVFEPRLLGIYAALVVLAAAAAALYPMRIVGTLPIAATLRRETAS